MAEQQPEPPPPPVTITLTVSPAQKVLLWQLIDDLWEVAEDEVERDLLAQVRADIRKGF